MSPETQDLLREAEALFSQREWDQALEKYQKIMQLDPQNEDACAKLAEIYAIRGQLNQVINQYFQLMDIEDAKNEHDLAVEVAKWIMKLQPENDKARMKMILIYQKKGDLNEVVKASLQLARLYIELGQGDQSIQLLSKAQETDPNNLDIGLELAEMYISHGHIGDGANQYRKIANAYLDRGQLDRAADAFKRMKVIQPDDPQLLFTLGNIYVKLGRLNEAETEFRSILRHNLNHVEALMALGEVCQQKGQFRDSILAFNKIISINPQEVVAKEKLGELFQAQGNTAESIKHYLAAAHAYQFGNDIPRAIRLYQRVRSMDTTNPTACRELTNLGAPLECEETEIETEYSPRIEPLAAHETPAPAPSVEEAPSAAPEERPSAATSADHADAILRGDAAEEEARARTRAGLTPKAGLLRPRGDLTTKAGLMKPKVMGKGQEAESAGKPSLLKGKPGEAGGGKPQLGRRSEKPVLGTSQAVQQEAPAAPAAAVQEAPPLHEEPAQVEQYAEEQYPPQEFIPAETPQPLYEQPEYLQEPPSDQGYFQEAPQPLFQSEYQPAQPLFQPEYQEEAAQPLFQREYQEAQPLFRPEYQEAAGPAAMQAEQEVYAEGPSAIEAEQEVYAQESAEPLQSYPLEEPVPEAPVEQPWESPLVEHAEAQAQEIPAEPPQWEVEPAPAEEPPPTLTLRTQPRRRLLMGAATPSQAEAPTAEVAGPEPAAEFEAQPPVEEPAPQPVEEPAAYAPVAPQEPLPPVELLFSDLGPSMQFEPEVQAQEETAAAPEIPSILEEPSPALQEIGEYPSPFDQEQPFAGVQEEVAAVPSLDLMIEAPPEPPAPQEPAVEASKLQEYIEAGDISRAVLAYRMRLDDMPDNQELRLELADVYFANGLLEEALREYRTLLESDPSNFDYHVRIIRTNLWAELFEDACKALNAFAGLLMERGELEAALDILQSSLVLDPEDRDSRESLCNLYALMGHNRFALFHMEVLADLALAKNDVNRGIDVLLKIYGITQDIRLREKLAEIYIDNGYVEEGVSELTVLAGYYLQIQENEKALAYLEKVVQITPDNMDAHQQLIDLYTRAGNKEKVIEEKFFLADRLIEDGKFDRSMQFLEDVLRLKGDHHQARIRLVDVYMRCNRTENALNEAQALSELFLKEKRYSDAIDLYNRLLGISPDNLQLREKLFQFYMLKEDKDKALEEILKIGDFYVRRNQYDDAIKLYRKALSLDERNVGVHYAIGVLHADHLNEPREAIAAFCRVYELDPSHKEGMKRLVGLLLEDNRPAEAVQVLNALIKLDRANELVRDEIIDEYKRRVEEHPEDNQSRYVLGVIYKELGLLDNAIEQFQRTKKVPELLLQSYDMLGMCFERKVGFNMKEIAIKQFKKGLETKGYRDEEYQELRYNLAELYNRNNMLTEAQKLYQDCFSVDINFKDVKHKLQQIQEELSGSSKITRLPPRIGNQ